VSDNRLDFFSYTPPYGSEDMQREIDILRAALAKSNAERDGARSMVIVDDWCKDPTAKHADLWAARGWPVPGPETTTLTCPYCDYREVVHAKPSPSDHSMCASCAMEHSE
jgi:hypothetical protein